MGLATVTINVGLPGGPVSGKYVCASTVSLSNVNVGFVPRYIKVWNATDHDIGATWTADMAAGVAESDTPAAVASGGITSVAQTDGTNFGFSVGTDNSVQEAQKTFNFMCWR